MENLSPQSLLGKRSEHHSSWRCTDVTYGLAEKKIKNEKDGITYEEKQLSSQSTNAIFDILPNEDEDINNQEEIIFKNMSIEESLFKKHCASTKAPLSLRSITPIQLNLFSKSFGLLKWIYMWCYPHDTTLLDINISSADLTYKSIKDHSHHIKLTFKGGMISHSGMNCIDFINYMCLKLTEVAENTGDRFYYNRNANHRKARFFGNILTLYEDTRLKTFKFPTPHFILSAQTTIDDENEDHVTYYIAFNSSLIGEEMEALGRLVPPLFDLKYIQNTHVPEYGYNERVCSRNNNEQLPSDVSKLCLLRKVLIYDAICSFLSQTHNLSEEDFDHKVHISVDYSFSVNPIFHVADLLLFREINPNTLDSYIYDEDTPSVMRRFDEVNDDGIPYSRKEFNKLMLYNLNKLARFWREKDNNHRSIQSRAINLYKNGHQSNKKTLERINNSLNNMFLLSQNDENWHLPDKVQNIRTLILPSLEALAKRELTAAQILDEIWAKYILPSGPKSDLVRENWTKIQEKLTSFEEVVKERANADTLLERRVVLRNFLLNYDLKGKSCADEIFELKNMVQYQDQKKAVTKWLIWTFGTQALVNIYDGLICKTNRSFVSKFKGILMSGDSKSMIWRLFFLPFKILELTTSKSQTVMSDKKISSVERKIYQVFHFIFVDEFGLGGFKNANGDNITLNCFNNLFDWIRFPKTIPTKNLDTVLLSNGPVICCSHYPKAQIIKNNDSSLESRVHFVDLNQPIFLKNKLRLPRQADENDTAYSKKCLEAGSACQKPLFPLRIRNASLSDEKKTMVDYSLALEELAEVSDLRMDAEMEGATSYIDREESIRNNPLSKEWSKFTELSEVQASFIMFEALMEIFDQLWKAKTMNQREKDLPLTEKTCFKHEDFKTEALQPSSILKYVDLIDDDLSLLCENIIEEYPNLYVGCKREKDLIVKGEVSLYNFL